MMTVKRVMDTDPVLVRDSMPVRDLAEAIQQHDPELTRHRGIFVVDSQKHLVGILTQADLLRCLPNVDSGHSVRDIAPQDVITAYPDETVMVALSRMLDADIGRLPVIARDESKLVLGYLSRGNIIAAHLQQLREETTADPGWLNNALARRQVGK